mgnify:FL=1
MPVLLLDSIFRVIVSRVPAFLGPLFRTVFEKAKTGFSKPRLDALLELAERDLSLKPWFAGEHLTAADIVMSYAMASADQRGYLGDRPHCRAWLERV